MRFMPIAPQSPRVILPTILGYEKMNDDTRLDCSDYVSPRPLTKCEETFADELALIRDRDLRAWVVGVFGRVCPDTFWSQPASTTGKYHPRASQGEGGLVRHTKLAVWWGLELARAFELESLNDKIVAALLLHDVLKRKDNVGMHGLEMAYAVEYYSMITEGIAYHMGKWTLGLKIMDFSCATFCNLIHLADYCAGRKVDAKLEELEVDHDAKPPEFDKEPKT